MISRTKKVIGNLPIKLLNPVIGNLPKLNQVVTDNKSVTFKGDLVFFNGNRVTYNPPSGD